MKSKPKLLWFRRQYARLNTRYWNGRLPHVQIILVRARGALTKDGLLRTDVGTWFPKVLHRSSWAMTAAWGDGRPFILFAPKLVASDRTFRTATVLHEMAHIATWDSGGDHRSRAWKREIRRLSRLGALAEVI